MLGGAAPRSTPVISRHPRPDGENMTTSEHIPFAQLADLAESRGPANERTRVLAHLESCSKCTHELERLGRVIELLRSDETIDPPRAVLAQALRIFDTRKQSSAPSLLQRVVAALSFDSSMNLAPAFGVRSGQVATRQLIYSAGESDIDLRISAQGDEWVVAGQLLGRECDGGRVEIEGTSGLAVAGVNELCEFTLPPLPPGSYTLRLLFRDAEVEIPNLELSL
jgi:hypothetical protein